MFSKFLLAAFAVATLTLCACAQNKPIRLIVRGDDMGFSHAGNEAMIKAYLEGIEKSIEVIVPSPWFPEAVKLLAEHSGVDVGVHIALTSEWDNMKWRPISNSPSLTDEDGYFYPMIWPNKNYPGRALLENKWKIEDVERELRAQIELAKKKIPRVSHISAHMGCTRMTDEVNELTKRLAKEYKIDIDPLEYDVKNLKVEGQSKSLDDKVAAFIQSLDQLKPGETYLIVTHPGLDTPELRAIHHVGNHDVAINRQVETSLLTDARVKKAIKEKNILLIDYKDIVSK